MVKEKHSAPNTEESCEYSKILGKILILKDYVDYQYNSNASELYILAEDTYILSSPSMATLDLLKLLRDTGVEYSGTDYENNEIWSFLVNENLLCVKYPDQNIENRTLDRVLKYFELYTSDPPRMLKRLGQKHVLILGLGGTGCLILQHLFSSGLKNASIVDCARVDLPDLNRQYIYNLSSVGNYKTSEAIKYVHSVQPKALIETHNIKIETDISLNIFDARNFDLVINACDTPNNLYEILNKFIIKNNYALYDAGLGLSNGEFGPFIVPGKTPCLECFNSYISDKMNPEEKFIRGVKGVKEKRIKASFGPTNSIVSALASLEIINFLCGINIKKYATQNYIDFLDLEFDSMNSLGVCECWSNN